MFTDEELASSRGQGLRNDNPEDNDKEPLNPDLCQICKGMSFVFFFLQKFSLGGPDVAIILYWLKYYIKYIYFC